VQGASCAAGCSGADRRSRTGGNRADPPRRHQGEWSAATSPTGGGRAAGRGGLRDRLPLRGCAARRGRHRGRHADNITRRAGQRDWAPKVYGGSTCTGERQAGAWSGFSRVLLGGGPGRFAGPGCATPRPTAAGRLHTLAAQQGLPSKTRSPWLGPWSEIGAGTGPVRFQEAAIAPDEGA
jgi:hypothetical protein